MKKFEANIDVLVFASIIGATLFAAGYYIGADHTEVIERIMPYQKCLTPSKVKALYLDYGKELRRVK